MQGFQLEDALRADKHADTLFYGVFAADQLPRTLAKLPALLIANTDCSHLPGQHWVAFYIDKHRRGEFFDSFGRRPFVREHKRFLSRVCGKWRHNPVPLQSLTGIVCGQYCVAYLLYRAHGRPLKNFVAMFTQAPEKNDLIVAKMFKTFSSCVKRHRGVSRRNTQTCCATKIL